MQLSVSELLTCATQSESEGQKEFSKLWSRIGKLKKSNATFSLKLSELTEQTAPILRGYEQQSILHMHAFVAKKLRFLTMKSLGKYNREDLSEWIEESFNAIQMLRPIDTDLLEMQIKQYNQTMAEFYEPLDETPDNDLATDLNDQQIVDDPDTLIRLFCENLKAEHALARENFIDNIALNPQSNLFEDEDKLAQFDLAQQQAYDERVRLYLNEIFTAVTASQQATDEEQAVNDQFNPADFEDHSSEDFHFNAQNTTTGKLRDLLENANVSKMFRKIAKKLHPDREQDPQQRLVKQELMAQAIQARDDGDIITLFDLYTTYVDKSDLYFDDQQLSAINALLKEQIKQLQEDKQEIIHSSQLNYQCHEFFYASSAKKIQTKIKAFKKQSAQEIDDLESLTYELKSLKVMKAVIGDRNNTRFILPFDDLNRSFNPFNH